MIMKCHKCNIVYGETYRTHCLYCDSALLDADFDEIFRTPDLQVNKKIEITKAAGVSDQDHLRYIVSSYFESRSLLFLYRLSRNEFKMGKKFKRILIEPVNLSSFAKIPWALINIVDSLMLRVKLNQYCPQCDWKYHGKSSKAPHDPIECEYNKEYAFVLKAILNGSILQSEEQIKQQALEKTKQGKKSAYVELSLRRSARETYFDVFVITSSLWIIICSVASLAMLAWGIVYAKLSD